MRKLPRLLCVTVIALALALGTAQAQTNCPNPGNIQWPAPCVLQPTSATASNAQNNGTAGATPANGLVSNIIASLGILISNLP